MGSSDIKSFYREEKKAGKKKKKNGGGAITELCSKIGSDQELHHRTAEEMNKEAEERLREFDMDMRYGPSVGLTRIERWDRASVFGLCPPADVEPLLLAMSAASHCLWEGRV